MLRYHAATRRAGARCPAMAGIERTVATHFGAELVRLVVLARVRAHAPTGPKMWDPDQFQMSLIGDVPAAAPAWPSP
jgi:hypothetical protein